VSDIRAHRRLEAKSYRLCTDRARQGIASRGCGVWASLGAGWAWRRELPARPAPHIRAWGNAPNLAALVTASEIEGVRNKIRPCWNTIGGAIMNPRCQPWPLSPEKYNSWRRFTFNFDPRPTKGRCWGTTGPAPLFPHNSVPGQPPGRARRRGETLSIAQRCSRGPVISGGQW